MRVSTEILKHALEELSGLSRYPNRDVKKQEALVRAMDTAQNDRHLLKVIYRYSRSIETSDWTFII